MSELPPFHGIGNAFGWGLRINALTWKCPSCHVSNFHALPDLVGTWRACDHCYVNYCLSDYAQPLGYRGAPPPSGDQENKESQKTPSPAASPDQPPGVPFPPLGTPDRSGPGPVLVPRPVSTRPGPRPHPPSGRVNGSGVLALGVDLAVSGQQAPGAPGTPPSPAACHQGSQA